MVLLPKPYPDEIVGSILLRGRRNYGLSLKSLLEWIHGPGTRRSTASFVLEGEISRLAPLCGRQPREMLYDHTVFPYVVAYLPVDYVSRLEARLLQTSASRAHCTSALAQNVTQVTKTRRYCGECALDDDLKYGETYWHRTHQLPTVAICLKHGAPLQHTDVKTVVASGKASSGLPPVTARSRRKTRPVSPRDVTLTQLSVEALCADGRLRQGWRERYRLLARSLGFVHPSGAVAGSALATALQGFYGDGFLERLASEMKRLNHTAWPALLLRPSEMEPSSVVRHLLLETFLAHGRIPPDLTSRLQRRPYPTRDYAQADRASAITLQQEIGRAIAEGRRTTVKSLLERAGIYSSYRHARDRFPECRNVLEEFRASDQSERQLGGREYWRKRTPSRWGATPRKIPLLTAP